MGHPRNSTPPARLALNEAQRRLLARAVRAGDWIAIGGPNLPRVARTLESYGLVEIDARRVRATAEGHAEARDWPELAGAKAVGT